MPVVIYSERYLGPEPSLGGVQGSAENGSEVGKGDGEGRSHAGEPWQTERTHKSERALEDARCRCQDFQGSGGKALLRWT